MKKLVLGFATLISTVSHSNIYAQTPSNAGALQQQIERERKSVVPYNKSIEVPEITESSGNIKDKGGMTITVKEFRFDGNTLLDAKKLNKAVASYLNRPVSFSELQNAAAAIGDLYRSRGWVVRSFIPEQDVAGGVVIIKIIEAKFGSTKTEGDLDIRLNHKKIDAMVAEQQNEGEPIHTKKLDRALLLIDDLPGVSVAGSLREGEKYGQTDLALKQTKEALATGAAIIDNAGSRSTGRERAHGFIQVNNPFGVGDLASFYLLGSEGVSFARMEQSFPVGYNGWRVGANASIMKYDLVAREFKGLDGEGSSTNMGLQASYPVIRERKKNLYFSMNYDHRYFDNRSQGLTSSNYNINSGTAGLKANFIDQIGGGGVNNASVSVSFGKLNLRSLNDGEDPTLEDSFRKISYNLSRQQKITRTLSFYTAVSAQATPDRKLDSSEMFYLGGSQGVRAYPVSEASGVDGHLINAELRWQFLPNYQLTGFYDHGYVHNSGSTKSYSLDGAGLELSLQTKFGFNVSGSWAHRIGNNPNPTSTGNDQDGSSLENRFWLTIYKQF